MSAVEIRKILASRVQEQREAKMWSQAKLAEEARVPQSAISDIEQAQRMPRGDTLSQIAFALKTTSSYLLGETAIPGPAKGTHGKCRETANKEGGLHETAINQVPGMRSAKL